MVDKLLLAFQPHLISHKKAAIDSFSRKYFGCARMNEADVKRLLIGGGYDKPKRPGLFALCGFCSKRHGNVVLARVAVKALMFFKDLMDPYEHRTADIVIKVFEECDPHYYELMRLDLHVKYKTDEDTVEFFKAKLGQHANLPQQQSFASLSRASFGDLESKEIESFSVPVPRSKSSGTGEAPLTVIYEPPTPKTQPPKGKGRILALLNNFFGGGRPDKDALRKNGIIKVGKTFGVELDQLCASGRDGVPDIIRDLVDACLDEERGVYKLLGVFRVSGDSMEIRQLKQIYDFESTPPDLATFGNHTLTGALKLFLRELPTPLFTYELYDPIVTKFRAQDRKSVV